MRYFIGVFHDFVDEISEMQDEPQALIGRGALILPNHPAIGILCALIHALARNESKSYRLRILNFRSRSGSADSAAIALRINEAIPVNSVRLQVPNEDARCPVRRTRYRRASVSDNAVEASGSPEATPSEKRSLRSFQVCSGTNAAARAHTAVAPRALAESRKARRLKCGISDHNTATRFTTMRKPPRRRVLRCLSPGDLDTRRLYADRLSLPSLETVRAMKVQTSNLGVIQMNNRNQQTARATAPAEAPAPTYLNVFTVEEYENNGKTGKKWTKIGAAFPHKEGIGFSIELKAFPIDGRLVALPPDTDEGNGRNGK